MWKWRMNKCDSGINVAIVLNFYCFDLTLSTNVYITYKTVCLSELSKHSRFSASNTYQVNRNSLVMEFTNDPRTRKNISWRNQLNVWLNVWPTDSRKKIWSYPAKREKNVKTKKREMWLTKLLINWTNYETLL